MPRIIGYIANAVTRIIVREAFKSFCKDNNIPCSKSGSVLSKHIKAFVLWVENILREEVSAEDREPFTHENQLFIEKLNSERITLANHSDEETWDEFTDNLAQKADEYTIEQKDKILTNAEKILTGKPNKVISINRGFFKEKDNVDTSDDSA